MTLSSKNPEQHCIPLVAMSALDNTRHPITVVHPWPHQHRTPVTKFVRNKMQQHYSLKTTTTVVPQLPPLLLLLVPG